MSDVELKLVEDLTEVQAEIADWYMGSTAVQEWFNEDYDHPEDCDFSDLPRPKLEDQRFAFPNDADVLDDFIYRVTQQYIQMAMDAAEIDTTQKMLGQERAANNLVEKVKDALDDEVVEECEKTRAERAEKIREASLSLKCTVCQSGGENQ